MTVMCSTGFNFKIYNRRKNTENSWPLTFRQHMNVCTHSKIVGKKTVIGVTITACHFSRGKKILKCSLVLRTSTPKLLLVLLPNNSGYSRKYNLALYLFYLPTGHWRKIYTCPDWNSTCPGLQDKWFFTPVNPWMSNAHNQCLSPTYSMPLP